MEETKLNIYPCKQQAYEAELRKIKTANISAENKEIITKFHNHLFAKGNKEGRVTKLSWQIRTICKWIKEGLGVKKNLTELDCQDIESLVSFVNRKPDYSEATKEDYRRAIKQFYLWLEEIDSRLLSLNEKERLEALNFYKKVKKIKRGATYKEIDPGTIITDEDIEKVVDKGAETFRDKAFLRLLHETGCRVGEFLNLRLRDISFEEDKIRIQVPDGKTGRRVTFATRSIPYLKAYLDIHPYKDNESSFLWVSQARNKRGHKYLLHRGAQKLIDNSFYRAGVQKKHNLHWFRHSRASILAPNVTEQILCKLMGWKLGSKQVRTYAHLCAKQIEDVFLEINGLTKKKEQTTQPIRCICGALNSPAARDCHKCYRPLKLETAIQEQELVNKEIDASMKVLMKIAQNPELMKQFEAFKKGFE